MTDFTPITTQKEFDKAVQARVVREQETLAKKYSDYDELKKRNTELETEARTFKSTIEELSNTAKTHEQTVTDLNAKIASQETASMRTRIALQNGLPFDLADRLVGDDEESIKADAERLAGFVSKPKPIAPLKSVEPNISDENKNWLQTARDLNGKGE
ncbi:capsid assembly scaffolding protein Gp46 family protein [Enterococcus sp. LJL120]